jgi:hypothetical protein
MLKIREGEGEKNKAKRISMQDSGDFLSMPRMEKKGT